MISTIFSLSFLLIYLPPVEPNPPVLVTLLCGQSVQSQTGTHSICATRVPAGSAIRLFDVLYSGACISIPE